MPKTKTIHELLIEEMRDLLDAEKQILKALPKMMKAVEDDELRSAFEEHRTVTEGQVRRLEQAFDQLGERARSKKCPGMAGLIEEAQEHISELDDMNLLEAALIGAAQKVEHYEIAAYGTLRAFARQCGEAEVAALFEQTLQEEKETDQRLTTLAESRINRDAEQGESFGDEDDADTRETFGASRQVQAAADRGQTGRRGVTPGRTAGARTTGTTARATSRTTSGRGGSRGGRNR